MILLNGRTLGDIPGKYTFLSDRGKSTIDLVWTNITCIPYVQFLDILPTIERTEHCICNLGLLLNHSPKHPSNIHTTEHESNITKFIWDQEISPTYHHLMEKSKNIDFNNTEPNESCRKLQDTIKDTATTLCMKKTAKSS